MARITTPELPPLVGQAPAFLDLMEQVSRIAPLDRPVLVVGERGTGKELIAARLHYLSPRWDRPLLKLNAAALPETLLDSELFGHEAGAFTGAVRQRRGRFELADGGSLFLDEIASTSLALQERLLRVVEYGAFERVGGSATVQVDVRLIGATNVDLPTEAAAGRFRHDLLDRLAFDVLTVPPLRARREDIPLLAEHFGRAMALDLGWAAFPGFAADALDALLACPWPGNVRELRNVVERAVYRAGSPGRRVTSVQFDPFASPFRPAPGSSEPDRSDPASGPHPPDERAAKADGALDFRQAVAAFERQLLEHALARHRHNQRATAGALGLSYDQLRHQLRKHGLLPARR
jgi:psp operon transcriptional activator